MLGLAQIVVPSVHVAPDKLAPVRTEAVKFGNKLEKIFSKVDWFYPQANLMFICI